MPLERTYSSCLVQFGRSLVGLWEHCTTLKNQGCCTRSWRTSDESRFFAECRRSSCSSQGKIGVTNEGGRVQIGLLRDGHVHCRVRRGGRLATAATHGDPLGAIEKVRYFTPSDKILGATMKCSEAVIKPRLLAPILERS